MNEAIVSVAPPSLQADQHLSRANVFGFFLTLQICQFTQPYGSLLFRGYGGLFWRCNPIASFVEACIIFLHLIHSTWRHTFDGQHAGFAGLWRSWQQTASSLLLLRGAINDSSGSALMEKLMTGSFLEEDTAARPTHIELNRVENLSDEPSSEEQVTGPSVPAHAVLRRRTTGLEAHAPHPSYIPPCRSNSVSTIDPRLERARLLDEAFGSNALAHREWRIDLVTFVAVFTICVKIFAIRGAPVLTVTALAMILGWLGVQVLLVLFHSRELSRSEMAASVKTARIQNAILKSRSPLFLGLFTALHVPFFAYATFQIVWKLSLIALFAIMLRFGAAGLLGAVVARRLAFVVHPLLRVVVQTAFRTPWPWSIDHTAAGLVAPCVVVFVALAFIYWPWGSVSPRYWTPEEDIARVHLFTNSTLIFVSAFKLQFYTSIYVNAPIIIHSLLVFFTFSAITVGFWNLSHLERSNASFQRLGITAGNTVFCIAIIVWYLFLYSAEGTYKPSWTEWLG